MGTFRIMDSPNNSIPKTKNASTEVSFDGEYVERLKQNPKEFQKFRETGIAMFALFKAVNGGGI